MLHSSGHIGYMTVASGVSRPWANSPWTTLGGKVLACRSDGRRRKVELPRDDCRSGDSALSEECMSFVPALASQEIPVVWGNVQKPGCLPRGEHFQRR